MDEQQRLVILLLVAFSVVLVSVGVLLVVLVRRQRARLVAGADPLGWQRIMVEGQEILHYWQPSGQRQSSALIIALACPTRAAWRIRREGGLERWFKRIGVNAELQLGDAAFDAAFYVDSSTPELLHISLNAHRRGVVARLFELGFTELELGQGWLRLVLSPAEQLENLPPGLIAQAAAELIELARGLPASPEHYPPLRPAYNANLVGGEWGARRLSAFALPSLLLMAMPIALGIGMDLYTPLDSSLYWHGLLAGVLLLVPYLWLQIRLLRGRAYAHVDLLIVAILGLIAVPLSGMGAAVLYNGAYDAGTAQMRSAVVTASWREKSDRSTYYYLGLASWREVGTDERLQVDYDTFARAVPGENHLWLTLRPGALGYVWVEEYALEARARSSGR